MSAGLELLKKYPLAITCFLVVLICLVLVVLRGDRVAQLSTEEDTLNSRIRVIEHNARHAVGIEADLEQVDAAVEEMRSRRFKRQERAVNANFFYDMETAFGVRITRIDQQEGGYSLYNDDGIHEMERNSTLVYDLSVGGQLPEILSFVQQFTQVEPFTRVTNLELSVGDRASGALNCDLTVVVLAEEE